MTTALTATAQAQYGRVLLQLTWTTVSSATVWRVHADGTTWLVRNADPATITATTGVGWVGYDHETPLDEPVTYQATSTQDATVVTSNTVTVASGGTAWLTHPLKPALGGPFVIRDLGDITYEGRGTTLPIIGRRDPIAMTDVELAAVSTVVVQTTTPAESAKIRALTADGAVLLLRLPPGWDDEPWLYIRRLAVTRQRYVNIAARTERRHVIPYAQAARQAGRAAGAVGVTYADVPAAYATYTAVLAGEATYLDLAIQPGP